MLTNLNKSMSCAFLNIHRLVFTDCLYRNRRYKQFLLCLQAKFKHFLYSGDVVLLELENPLEFGETVTAACLSDEPINKDAEFCISVGWFSEEGIKKHI